MKRLLLALALLGCANPASAPVIGSFTATPDTIHLGQSATLAWDVSGAQQLSIDDGVGIQNGHSVTVWPQATTTYTLTATGLSGDSNATATVTVLPPLPKPVIASFKASPAEVAIGGQTTLSWAVTGADSLSIDEGVGAVTGLSKKSVTVSADTLYTLTATNGGGSATLSVPVKTHVPGAYLTYTDPTRAAKIVIVGNPDIPGMLDVKVGPSPVTAFGFAINIPLDPAGAGMVALATVGSSAIPGLETTGAINVGSSPVTATAKVGGAVMPGVLSVGVAKNKASAGSGDDTWQPGTRLFSIAFQTATGAAAGNTVFTGAALMTDARFKAAAIAHDGSTVLGTSDVAIGDLAITP